MLTQSSLSEKFVDFMRETLKTNDALISQQTKLYEFGCTNKELSAIFMSKAEKVNVLTAKELIDIGVAKVKDLNLESSTEMQFLQAKLQHVFGITDDATTSAIENH
ncbi:unnamed protein product [Didymodactylos carnosus]|uniref:Uncharacterized protein n=1 Tax=Didymodactylos carnosus TaxID=1234261 RepID=A0A815YU51_9BILA|nr:unnamed protein product [Didymodactylos carnosus]CAF4440354.1 unnamed protein product [Didymodactylos carnosus]